MTNPQINTTQAFELWWQKGQKLCETAAFIGGLKAAVKDGFEAGGRATNVAKPPSASEICFTSLSDMEVAFAQAKDVREGLEAVRNLILSGLGRRVFLPDEFSLFDLPEGSLSEILQDCVP